MAVLAAAVAALAGTPAAPAAGAVAAPAAVVAPAEGAAAAPAKVAAPVVAPEAAKPAVALEDAATKAMKERERAIVADKQKHAQQVAAATKRATELDAREKSLSDRLAKAEAIEKLTADAKRNPTKALEALGVTGEQYAAFVKNGGQLTPELVQAIADERYAENEKRQASDREKQAAETAKRTQAEYDTAVTEMRGNAVHFVASSDKYELTKAFNAGRMVADVIQESAAGERLLSYDEAAAKVESTLQEQADVLAKTKWFGERYAPKAPPSAAPPKTEAPAAAAPSKTISNRLAATTPPAAPVKILSEAERRANAVKRAEEMMRGRPTGTAT